jgi:hypothetical protein
VSALLLPCLLAGCYVRVNKGKNGEDKDVEVHMPMGAVHVQQDTPSASEMQLPSYPGATIVEDKHGSSANVNVGFGDWQLHVRVAQYQTGDPQTKVTSFYRTALAHYGDVIECRDGHSISATPLTRDGLGCDDSHPGSKGVHFGDDDGGFSLRAGSRRHQHIVGIKPGDGTGTRFTLVRLDLPANLDHEDKQEE